MRPSVNLRASAGHSVSYPSALLIASSRDPWSCLQGCEPLNVGVAMSETDLHFYVDQAAKGLQEMSGRARNIHGPPKKGISP